MLSSTSDYDTNFPHFLPFSPNLPSFFIILFRIFISTKFPSFPIVNTAIFPSVVVRVVRPASRQTSRPVFYFLVVGTADFRPKRAQKRHKEHIRFSSVHFWTFPSSYLSTLFLSTSPLFPSSAHLLSLSSYSYPLLPLFLPLYSSSSSLSFLFFFYFSIFLILLPSNSASTSSPFYTQNISISFT